MGSRGTISAGTGVKRISGNLRSGHTGANTLVNQLGLDIVSGRFAAGQRLPKEAVMLEDFRVSRTALREAYSKLTAKGLIEARPKVGTSVRTRKHWNLLDQDVLDWHLATVPAEDLAEDLYALRRMIEPGAATLAAELRTEDDLAAIFAAFEGMVENAADDQRLVDSDFDFHVAILTATRNPFMNAFSSLIQAAMLATFEHSWRGAEVIKEVRLDQHLDVAKAIADQDGKRAGRKMQFLLDESIKDVMNSLD